MNIQLTKLAAIMLSPAEEKMVEEGLITLGKKLNLTKPKLPTPENVTSNTAVPYILEDLGYKNQILGHINNLGSESKPVHNLIRQKFVTDAGNDITELGMLAGKNDTVELANAYSHGRGIKNMKEYIDAKTRAAGVDKYYEDKFLSSAALQNPKYMHKDPKLTENLDGEMARMLNPAAHEDLN